MASNGKDLTPEGNAMSTLLFESAVLNPQLSREVSRR